MAELSYLSSENLLNQRVHVFGIESVFQGGHFIDTAAQRPDIRLERSEFG